MNQEMILESRLEPFIMDIHSIEIYFNVENFLSEIKNEKNETIKLNKIRFLISNYNNFRIQQFLKNKIFIRLYKEYIDYVFNNKTLVIRKKANIFFKDEDKRIYLFKMYDKKLKVPFLKELEICNIKYLIKEDFLLVFSIQDFLNLKYNAQYFFKDIYLKEKNKYIDISKEKKILNKTTLPFKMDKKFQVYISESEANINLMNKCLRKSLFYINKIDKNWGKEIANTIKCTYICSIEDIEEYYTATANKRKKEIKIYHPPLNNQNYIKNGKAHMRVYIHEFGHFYCWFKMRKIQMKLFKKYFRKNYRRIKKEYAHLVYYFAFSPFDSHEDFSKYQEYFCEMYALYHLNELKEEDRLKMKEIFNFERD